MRSAIAMDVRAITAEQARVIRHPILRAGFPPETASFPGDDEASTTHVGAFDGGRLVAVATFFPEPCPERPGVSAYRLRGMATLPEWRGRGGGRALVREGERIAAESGARLLWCNARITAQGFYERLGFTVEAGPFELPMSGRHNRMLKPIESSR